ncbi:hypothetical protein GCM10027592_27780 [Spirosoma flavus]
MKPLYSILCALLLGTPLLAQNNYVATSPTSAAPGTKNVIVGIGASNTAMTGGDNVFVGYQAGNKNTEGFDNAFLGYQAGNSNTTGRYNVFVGSLAGLYNSTGTNNTVLGYQAGHNNNGSLNTFVGNQAGFFNTIGGSNTFMGNDAGQKNLLGNDNAFVGAGTGFNNTVGSRNTFFGKNAGTNSNGNNNAFFGVDAGSNTTTGSNNTMLGYNAQPVNGTLQNAVAIGYNATVALNNAIVLGDPANTSIAVGIGTNAPQYPLDVRGIINLRNNGRIKFAHLSNPLFQGTTDQFLTVNEVGETVLARHRLRIDNVTQWSDKVFEPTYQLPTLSEVERYVTLHRHLSNVPSAREVVKEGVDLVRMNATLLEKVEELTLYTIQLEKSDKANKQELQQQKARIEELERLMKQFLLEKK